MLPATPLEGVNRGEQECEAERCLSRPLTGPERRYQEEKVGTGDLSQAEALLCGQAGRPTEQQNPDP